MTHLSKMSALGEMASGIAHEIYNPLSIIFGFCELILRKNSKGILSQGELRGLIGELKGTSERINRIVEGLRFFAREGSQDPLESVFVSAVISNTIKICSERFKRYGVLVEVIHENEAAKIFCRPVQISQVLLNLLNNSFDALQNEEFKKISITTKMVGSEIWIDILDTGAGIPAGMEEKIFEPFYTTKTVGSGTGMGLSISKGIMEANHGSIRLISSSHGTRFQLRSPQGAHDRSE